MFSAFDGCFDIKRLYLSSDIKIIEKRAFYGCCSRLEFIVYGKKKYRNFKPFFKALFRHGVSYYLSSFANTMDDTVHLYSMAFNSYTRKCKIIEKLKSIFSKNNSTN